jgi:hypothetical protein
MPEPLLPRRIIGPAHLHWHWLLGYILILAVVPPCAGECRLVRVIGVLIFANARTCVASVLLAAAARRSAGPSGSFSSSALSMHCTVDHAAISFSIESDFICTVRIIENSIRRNRDRWPRGRNQEMC